MNIFLNKEVVNKNNEKGVVTSFDVTFVTVKYKDFEKQYKTFIAFKNKFLSFVDDSLNLLIEQIIAEDDAKKQQQQKMLEKTQEDVLEKINRVNNLYDQLKKKFKILKKLFGADFVYLPYVEFLDKYKLFIKNQSNIDRFYDYFKKFNI